MANPAEQFKINLNQNLWGLVVSFGALGTSERYRLRTLFWFSVIASSVMITSVAVTALAYTLNYWKDKMKT